MRVAGWIAGGCVAIVLVGLIVAEVTGTTVPTTARPLVVLLFALACGFAAGAIVGTAEVTGQGRPLAGTEVQFSFAGGFAAALLAGAGAWFVYPVDSVLPSLHLESVRGGSASPDDHGGLVVAAFTPVSSSGDFMIYFSVASDPQCRAEVARGRVDNPLNGTMRLFVQEPRESVVCGQLLALDRDGTRVAQSGAVKVRWQP